MILWFNNTDDVTTWWTQGSTEPLLASTRIDIRLWGSAT